MLQQQRESFAHELSFRVKGVSMKNDITGESRQALLARSDRNGPLILAKERDNPVDPEAVKVSNTEAQIGYVPRELTNQFEHGHSPGYLEWVAAAAGIADALLGAQVVCVPTLRAAHCQVLPRELVPWADLSATLPAWMWQGIEQQVLESTFGCCQLTGLADVRLKPEQADSPCVPACVLPVWSVQERRGSEGGAVVLEGFVALCMPAAFALHYLDLEALHPRHAGVPLVAAPGPVHDGNDSSQTAVGLPGTDCGGRGSVARLLDALAEAYGEDHAVDVAREAANDMIVYGNSFYDKASAEPCVQLGRHWTLDDVQKYIASCWTTQQRLSGKQLKLDLSHLLTVSVGGKCIQAKDIPASLLQFCEPL